VLSNVRVSLKVARVLRRKEMSGFLPVSATDLVWQEAMSMVDVDQGCGYNSSNGGDALAD